MPTTTVSGVIPKSLKEDLLFRGGGTTAIAAGASYTAHFHVDVPTYFDITGTSYLDDFVMEIFEGGTHTGGVSFTPVSFNRQAPTRVFEGHVEVGVTFDDTAATLLATRTVVVGNQSSSGFTVSIGAIIFKQDTNYYVRVTNTSNQINTVGWTSEYIVIPELKT